MKPNKDLRNKIRATITPTELALKDYLVTKYNDGDNYFELKGEHVGHYLSLRLKDKWLYDNTQDPNDSSMFEHIEDFEHIQVLTVAFKDDPIF